MHVIAALERAPDDHPLWVGFHRLVAMSMAHRDDTALRTRLLGLTRALTWWCGCRRSAACNPNPARCSHAMKAPTPARCSAAPSRSPMHRRSPTGVHAPEPAQPAIAGERDAVRAVARLPRSDQPRPALHHRGAGAADGIGVGAARGCRRAHRAAQHRGGYARRRSSLAADPAGVVLAPPVRSPGRCPDMAFHGDATRVPRRVPDAVGTRDRPRPSRNEKARQEWSGREDLNLRPLRPERSALPG
jgi:hypothetical protein